MTRRNDNWIFGRNSHIEFPGGGSPIVRPASMISTDEGCASVSDENGDLLFYTDGSALWDYTHRALAVPNLGGSKSATQSALIVPPAGGGSEYHIFAVDDADMIGVNMGPIMYTRVAVDALRNVTVVAGPLPLPGGPILAGEQLAAVSHTECDKVWVIAVGTPVPVLAAPLDAFTQHAEIYSIRVDGDVTPTTISSAPYGAANKTGRPDLGYTAAFSPSGERLAFSAGNQDRVDLFHFDRTTGMPTPHASIEIHSPYGVEFSPDSSILWMSSIRRGDLAYSGWPMNSVWQQPAVTVKTFQRGPKYHLGALRRGPDGKIYGVKNDEDTLFVIEQPNNTTTPSIQDPAPNLQLPDTVTLGLPSLVVVADSCDGGCAQVEDEVNQSLTSKAADKHNRLESCEDDPRKPNGGVNTIDRCRPFEHDLIEPSITIRWGDSDCDCLESDDVETVLITVCNPHSNVVMSDFKITRIRLTNPDGTPVDLLPECSPSVETTPMGPFCFGDLGPCSCVTREFVVQTRGARHGEYKLLLEGLCFDICLHSDTDACFVLDVCEDR